MPELWPLEDDLPACIPCLSGVHDNCPDLHWTTRWGLMACGCDDLEHEHRDLLEDGNPT